jgi:hypothetical protein
VERTPRRYLSCWLAHTSPLPDDDDDDDGGGGGVVRVMMLMEEEGVVMIMAMDLPIMVLTTLGKNSSKFEHFEFYNF